MEILTENYNGYRFHKKTENAVFNSNMVLYFLDEYQLAKAIPDQLTDPNMRSDYHKFQFFCSISGRGFSFTLILSGITYDKRKRAGI